MLKDGHTGPGAAGQVIEAFGDFIVSGNYAVGIFVFSILVIINLVVITKGAGRVSEVSARFTLDALPGKQMAIDADLNAGILTPDEAKARREEVTKEADFYGSMDGASKFVKGDAIAAILILLVNIIGGLIIGLLQHDLSIGVAAEAYILLASDSTDSVTSTFNCYSNNCYKSIIRSIHVRAYNKTGELILCLVPYRSGYSGPWTGSGHA